MNIVKKMVLMEISIFCQNSWVLGVLAHEISDEIQKQNHEFHGTMKGGFN